MKHWGQIPSYHSKGTVSGGDFFKIFNARLETLDHRSTFSQLLQTKRCVIFINGYFEWVDKQPYFVTRKDEGPMLLAGLHETWRSGSGRQNLVESFVIVTESSDKIETGLCEIKAGKWSMNLKNLHERVPVILSKSESQKWLSEGLQMPANFLRATQPHRNRNCNDFNIYPVIPERLKLSYQNVDITQSIKVSSVNDFFGTTSTSSASSDHQWISTKFAPQSSTREILREKKRKPDLFSWFTIQGKKIKK
jgi:putative SOS response-associated peptidase YedK